MSILFLYQICSPEVKQNSLKLIGIMAIAPLVVFNMLSCRFLIESNLAYQHENCSQSEWVITQMPLGKFLIALISLE